MYISDATAIESLSIRVEMWVQAGGPGGDPERTGESMDALAIQPGEVERATHTIGRWADGMIDIRTVRLSDFLLPQAVDIKDQFTPYVAAIRDAFRSAATFLTCRTVEVFDAMRAAGLSVHMVVNLKTYNMPESDYALVRLVLPPALLLECGRLSLPLTVTTNFPYGNSDS